MSLDEKQQSPKRLAECLHDGTLGLPDFQRPSVWAANQQRELLESLVRGLSIGVITLWKPPAGSKAERQRPFFPNQRSRRHELLVLDGQQRLRALCALCRGPDPIQRAAKTIWIGKEGRFRAGKTAREGDVSTADVAQQPVEQLVRGRPAAQKNAIRLVRDALTSDSVTVIVVPLRQDGDAIELFERINSRGQRLAQKDLVAARLSEAYPEYITKCDQLSLSLTGGEGTPKLSCFDRMVLTKVVAFGATKGKTAKAKDAHDIILRALHGDSRGAGSKGVPAKSLLARTRRAGERLRKELLSVFGFGGKLTESALDGSAATVALQFLVAHPKPSQADLTAFRRWLLVMLFSTYYTGGATESKVDVDLKEVSARKVNWRALFRRANEELGKRGVVLRASPQKLELETDLRFWRLQRNRRYLEILRRISIANQLLLGWCDRDQTVRLGDEDATLQHIFPRNPRKTRALKRGVNLKENPANYATIESKENSSINNKDPHEYLEGVDQRARVQQHVPTKRYWTPAMQMKFLDKRTLLILKAVALRYKRGKWA
jgi:hypothetical protein